MFLKKMLIVGLLCTVSIQMDCRTPEKKQHYKVKKTYSKGSLHKVCAHLAPVVVWCATVASLGMLCLSDCCYHSHYIRVETFSVSDVILHSFACGVGRGIVRGY